MRLAMFSYGLPVTGQKRGGIERCAHVLAQGLAERGHAVVVFSHDPQPPGARYQVRPLPWGAFVNTWLGRRITMGYLGNVLALLPDYSGFDAIVAHGDSLFLPLVGKPVLRVMHGSAWSEATHATSPGRFLLQAGVYVQEVLTTLTTPGTVAVSDNTRRQHPFIRHTIPHGVDMRTFHPEPREKSPVPSILFVGTRDGRKRGSFLIDIFQRVVRPAYADAVLMFVGPPGANAPGITYHTGIDDEELASLYRRAWVYASPSTYEGFGLPYMEAMACGTAVLATPNAGSREVIGAHSNGRLVEDDAFGSSLLELLSDAGRRRASEAAGMLRAREFSLDVMIDRYEALLTQLCGAHARSIATA
jgi:glycosyltransferase involved in cell wall biosynthesis